jgi:hypothetical protein
MNAEITDRTVESRSFIHERITLASPDQGIIIGLRQYDRAMAIEPIREVWIHDEWLVASRLSMRRFMASWDERSDGGGIGFPGRRARKITSAIVWDQTATPSPTLR